MANLAKKPDGGFEMLLGDRQLLSLFVIVVVLLGVFFTMGYLLGRHTGTASTEAIASKEPVVQVTPRAAPSGALPVSKPAESVPEPVAPPSTPVVAPVAAPPVVSSAPAAGQTFLQLKAIKRPEAELVAGVLKKRGFPSMVAPSTKEGLFRVLVGPLDKKAIAGTRKDLEKAGFPDAIVMKY
jgi:cell division septation protein DedD